MAQTTMTKQAKRYRRHARLRMVIVGTSSQPRLSVHRSLVGMYAQLIDDGAGITLVAVHSRQIESKTEAGGRTGKVALAYLLGKALAEKAKKAGIEKVVFDRSGYKYHGRVQALAEGAREGGLKF
jgi:large subunit ribosomal protein L18